MKKYLTYFAIPGVAFALYLAPAYVVYMVHNTNAALLMALAVTTLTLVMGIGAWVMFRFQTVSQGHYRLRRDMAEVERKAASAAELSFIRGCLEDAGLLKPRYKDLFSSLKSILAIPEDSPQIESERKVDAPAATLPATVETVEPPATEEILLDVEAPVTSPTEQPVAAAPERTMDWGSYFYKPRHRKWYRRWWDNALGIFHR